MAALRLLLRRSTPNRQKCDAVLTDQVDRYELAAKITDIVVKQLKWNHDQLNSFVMMSQNLKLKQTTLSALLTEENCKPNDSPTPIHLFQTVLCKNKCLFFKEVT